MKKVKIINTLTRLLICLAVTTACCILIVDHAFAQGEEVIFDPWETMEGGGTPKPKYDRNCTPEDSAKANSYFERFKRLAQGLEDEAQNAKTPREKAQVQQKINRFWEQLDNATKDEKQCVKDLLARNRFAQLGRLGHKFFIFLDIWGTLRDYENFQECLSVEEAREYLTETELALKELIAERDSLERDLERIINKMRNQVGVIEIEEGKEPERLNPGIFRPIDAERLADLLNQKRDKEKEIRNINAEITDLRLSIQEVEVAINCQVS